MQEEAYENAVSQLIPGKQPEQATLMTDLPRPRRLICSLVTGLVLMMGYIDWQEPNGRNDPIKLRILVLRY